MSTTESQPLTRAPTAIVVLTGASSGIGRATANALAQRGAALVLAARDREALEVVARECNLAGVPAEVLTIDVENAQSMRDLATAAIDRFGRFDVWINNVGVGAVGRFDEVPLEAHRRVIESNLIGHMNGAHAALAHFRKRGRGILINMVSLGAWLSAPYASAYSASKFALRGFGQALRAELADTPDIHVCDVYPGFVDTPGVAHGANYTGRRLKPLPPLLSAHRVAEHIVSLVDNPRPNTVIGSTAYAARLTSGILPELRGRLAKWFLDTALSRADSAPISNGNLFEPSLNHSIEGGFRHGFGRAVLGLTALSAAGLAWYALRQRWNRPPAITRYL
jgi:short-subunit dehydrogenase